MSEEDVERSSRSRLMSRVRQRGTGAELAVGRALRRAGHSYRLNVKSLPGSPDFANRKLRWAIFVHGCFWHHHTNCRRATVPKNNRVFWRQKFEANRRRDARAIRALRRKRFRVAVLWECQVVDPLVVAAEISKLLEPRRVDVAEPVDH